MLEERFHNAALFDLYGALLTEKQQSCLTMYFFEDYSLSEIGDALGVSRQAAYDLLHRSERTLAAYEERLGLLSRRQKEQAVLGRIYDRLAAMRMGDEAERQSLLSALAPLLERGGEDTI
ncbi:MAG: transcriptional regulator [Schwartzia sp.]|nr:transcriptional regulator [Schwartzia sp. (in: firmicutes)]